MDDAEELEERRSNLAMSSEQFRNVGHQLIDKVADFLTSLSTRPVTLGKTHHQVQEALFAERTLPATGCDTAKLLDDAADLLFDHSLLNGHPRFWGYITSSAAPVGALADLLAAAVNPNVGA